MVTAGPGIAGPTTAWPPLGLPLLGLPLLRGPSATRFGHAIGNWAWGRGRLTSADAVQPAHGHALPGVAVDLQILVPGLAQGDTELAFERPGVVTGAFHESGSASCRARG